MEKDAGQREAFPELRSLPSVEQLAASLGPRAKVSLKSNMFRFPDRARMSRSQILQKESGSKRKSMIIKKIPQPIKCSLISKLPEIGLIGIMYRSFSANSAPIAKIQRWTTAVDMPQSFIPH